MSVSRRHLLAGSVAVAGLGAANGLAATASASASVRPSSSLAAARCMPTGRRFSPLKPVGDLLALPEGFGYTVVAETGVTDVVDASGRVIAKSPGNPDGAGAFAHRNRLRLVLNHELRGGDKNPVPHVEGTVYDPVCLGGGCTVIETTREGARVKQWVGLSGTIRNCAGGVTPWDSWLSCEETEEKAGAPTKDGRTYTKDHGYVFEVFPYESDRQLPKPIYAWGRAVWEGANVEPSLRRAYLTEDTKDGLLYRWTAPAGVKLRPYIADQLAPDAGVLEAMAVMTDDGTVIPHFACVTSALINRPLRTTWVAIPDRQARTKSLVAQGAVTRHPKIEGCWNDGKGLWFTCSLATATDLPWNAPRNRGMVFYYDFAEGTLTLKVYYPWIDTMPENDAPAWVRDTQLDGPDNITVSPFGTIVLAEDGDGASHLISWTEGLGSQAIALNRYNDSEWAGPCFAPRGDVLFASIQGGPGRTFAITGPWAYHLRG